HDNSAPIIVDGLEEVEVPTLFYSIDTHHHYDFHRYLAHVFDYTLVAQKDYIPEFERVGGVVEWMPLWAPKHFEPAREKRFGAGFVGTLDEKLNPDRVRVFGELGELVSVLYKQGHYFEIFPYSELVINQTVKGDMNFRIFESMMCGACLLTEEGGNGLTDLFTPGEHLLTYRRNDAADAA